MKRELSLEGATRVVMSAVREAVRRGLPAYAVAASPGAVIVETPWGRALYDIHILYDESGVERSIGMGFGGDYVVVALVEAGGYTLLPWNVPYAIATASHAMHEFVADVWAQRLKSLNEAEPCNAPQLLPGKPHCLRSNPCQVAFIDEHGVVGWLDRCTGLLDDARPWQRRMGLRD